MNQKQAIERLPWLLNGTLDEDEQQQVERWIADSPQVCEELENTRQIWQLQAVQPPAEDLVAYVEGTLEDDDREWVETYLERSESGRQEVALLRQGRMLVEAVDGGEITMLPQKPGAAVPRASATPLPQRNTWLTAVAAALVSAIGASLIWWQTMGSAGPETVGQVADGRLNVPIVEMLPNSSVLRGDGASDTGVSDPSVTDPSVTLKHDQDRVVLILVSEQDPGSVPLAIEARDTADAVFWSAQGLERDPRGEYTVSLTVPRDVEHISLEIFTTSGGQRQTIDRYRLRIHRQPETAP